MNFLDLISWLVIKTGVKRTTKEKVSFNQFSYSREKLRKPVHSHFVLQTFHNKGERTYLHTFLRFQLLNMKIH